MKNPPRPADQGRDHGPAVEPPPPLASRLGMAVAFTAAEVSHRLHWEQALDAGLIENRNPPPAPEVVAIREANDRLFRARARRHRRGEA